MSGHDTQGIHDRTLNGVAKPPISGQYIVTDPKICHGKPTFRGTRIFVKDILEMVAEGVDWDTIMHEWHGKITREAIAEAVLLAPEVLNHHGHDLTLEPIV